MKKGIIVIFIVLAIIILVKEYIEYRVEKNYYNKYLVEINEYFKAADPKIYDLTKISEIQPYLQ